MIARTSQYSLADLGLGFAAASLVLGAFVATDFFATCLVVLVLAVIPMRTRRYDSSGWFRFHCRLAVVISSLLLALQIAGCVLFKIGTIHNPRDWPDPIHRLVSAVGAHRSEVRVYCLGDFLDVEYIAQMPVKAKELNRIVSCLEGFRDGESVREIPVTEVGTEFRELFPWWWRPSLRGNVKFYAADANYLLVMHDADSDQLYVRYWFNF
jgi:hypothetical protein